MKYLLILIQLAVFSFNALSQDHKPCMCDVVMDSVFFPKLVGTVYDPLPSLIGTEFYNKNYVRGNIVLTNGDTAKNIKIRYNGRVDGLLYWPSNSGTEILLEKYYIKEFSLDYPSESSKSLFYKIRAIPFPDNDTSEVFCQLLYRNKLSLYAFRQCIFSQEINNYVNNILVAGKSYEPSTTYYFKLPNNKTIGFKRLTKRSLLAIFPQNKDQLKVVLRQLHQRRFKKEEDFIKLSAALNESNMLP